METDKKQICTWCNKKTPAYNSILIPGETRNFRVCLHCYNQEISKVAGIEYDQVQLHPVILKDRDDMDHKFHFSLKLMGDIQLLKAVEMQDGRPCGYEFSMTGETSDGIFLLFSNLYTKMLTALDQKHISKNLDTGQWQITPENRVKGQIRFSRESNGSSGTPAICIDGKILSWEEFGRMLVTYEGFNFKLHIIDNEEANE